ncbi:dolichyl-P-Man:Man(7)GlcNAc(2)-PP-dolichol alpha-1,6-mannosyltransferase [Cladochytrium tenue]|nr:dolichyl-P-Man:Man(7)GlcNAc(2)-PP-dolichol alpha-1,6-mannosyltransferase [Cladochytrium tenue]
MKGNGEASSTPTAMPASPAASSLKAPAVQAVTATSTAADASKLPAAAVTDDPQDLSDYDLMAILPGLGWDVVTFGLMVITARFSKVEESFNMQAVHDLLAYGVPRLQLFDHLEFPGVVPRTFHAAFAVSTIAGPAVNAFSSAAKDNFDMPLALYMTRFAVALLVVVSLRAVREVVRRIYGASPASWFALLGLSEFHLIFWGSRTIPNTFALVLSNLVVAFWIDNFKPYGMKEVRERNRERSVFGAPPLSLDRERDRKARMKTVATAPPKPTEKGDLDLPTILMIAIAVYATLVHRLELAAVFAPIFLIELYRGRLRLFSLATVITVAAAASIASTVIIDSYMWRRKDLWPEAESFFFNILEGRSQEYGVSPFYTYFLLMVPRIAPVAYLLSFYAAWVDARARLILIPAVFHVAVMSLVGHKEWRFVFYVVPLFNIAGGLGAARIYRLARGVLQYTVTTSKETVEKVDKDGKKTTATETTTTTTRRRLPFSRFHRFVAAPGLLFALILAFVASEAMLQISAVNYPGGVALEQANFIITVPSYYDDDDTAPPIEYPHIHLDTFVASTGATRFGEFKRSEGWRYSKKEGLESPQDYIDSGFTHLVTSTPDFHLAGSGVDHWRIVGHVRGLDYARPFSTAELYDWLSTSATSVLSGKLAWAPRRLVFGVPIPVHVSTAPKAYLLESTTYKSK